MEEGDLDGDLKAEEEALDDEDLKVEVKEEERALTGSEGMEDGEEERQRRLGVARERRASRREGWRGTSLTSPGGRESRW